MTADDRQLTDPELLAAQVRTLFTHDARGRLLGANEPWGSGPAPRLFIGRTRAGNLWRLRADLPGGLVAELEALCAHEPVSAELRDPPRHHEAYLRLLEAHAPVGAVEAGPAYRFAQYPEPSRPLLPVTDANAELLRGGFEDFIPELPTAQPFLAVIEGGRAVSVCRSVRITREAHEAGVETLPDARRRGYAAAAVAGWARAVRALGAVPLYSTSWENVASQAVAATLRLVAFGADFHIA